MPSNQQGSAQRPLNNRFFPSMAGEAIIPLIICLLVLEMPVSVNSQAQAPSGCTVSVTRLVNCLSYVTGKANSPSKDCCSSLTSIARINESVACLCKLFAVEPNLDVYMNRTRVLQTPAQCNISVTSVMECQGLGIAPVVQPTRKSNATSSNLSNDASDSFVSPSIQVLAGLIVLKMAWILGL